MENLPEKIQDELIYLIRSVEIKSLIENADLKNDRFFILNPQITIKAYLDHDKQLIIESHTNGNNGFTSFKKTIPLKEKRNNNPLNFFKKNEKNN